jgi:hypothetical protein
MKMAAKMMESMTAEDLERMTAMAQNMGMGGGAAGGAGAGAATTAAAAPPGGAVFPGMGAAGMDPGAMASMRRQLADPGTLRSMQSMLKGMDPEALSSMLKSTGVQMEPAQAARMVERMGEVSERQLAWVARLAALVNFLLDAYQRARAWAAANAALALALAALVLAIFLRWRGWM